MKKIIGALVAGCMLLGATPALASGVNITINDEEFIPKNALGEVVYPFIENGSTYLPVRAMGEAVGKEVSFDADNYAVYIGVRPMEADLERVPVVLVGDRVFYEEDMDYYGDIDNIVDEAKVIALAKSKFTEEEIEEYYNEICEMAGGVELEEDKRYAYYSVCAILLNNVQYEDESILSNYVTAKHILVEDELVAKEIIEKIENGTSFDDLIEEYNTDPGQTKDSSYTFTFGKMVEEFEKAAFELEENEYTKEPVPTAYGYHIIKRLPIEKEYAYKYHYQNIILPMELENVDIGKVVEVKRTGTFGKIENTEITTKELDMLFGSESSYEDRFEALKEIVTFYRIMEENSLFIEERALYKAELENNESLNAFADKEKQEYFLDLICAYWVAIDTFTGGNVVDANIAELFENEENHPVIEYEIYKQLRVFVDGKIIVPADVNNNYVEPKNIDGTVYVPVRAIVEALGMKAGWNNDTRTVVIEK